MASSQFAAAPASEQEQRAKWDLLLLDLEHRAEQVRQLKSIDLTIKSYEFWKMILQAIVAFATVFAAGGVVGGLLVRIMSGHGG